MKVSFSGNGRLTIKPENDLENYALRKWWDSWTEKKGDALLQLEITAEDNPNVTNIKHVQNND